MQSHAAAEEGKSDDDDWERCLEGDWTAQLTAAQAQGRTAAASQATVSVTAEARAGSKPKDVLTSRAEPPGTSRRGVAVVATLGRGTATGITAGGRAAVGRSSEGEEEGDEVPTSAGE